MEGGSLGERENHSLVIKLRPGCYQDIEQFCGSCPERQQVSLKKPFKVPLQSLLIIEPFARIALDVIGLLPKSTGGHQFVLVLLDCATSYPEAVPLRAVTNPKVAEGFLKWVL